MNVELRHLRYFLAVADELHFGRAAERVHIAQPAISQQIQRLEAELGVELFARTRREVRLTAAGTALRPFAERALADVAVGAETARRAAAGEVGHLTVGFIETASTIVVPQAVRQFRAERPDVSLTLRELGVEVQLEGLRSGRLDVAIVRPPFEDEGLTLEQIADEPLVAAIPARHELASRRRLSAKQAADQPLVALSREVVPGLYDQLLAMRQESGGTGRIEQEASSIQAVLGLVAAGLGLAILPASVRSLSREGVVFAALSAPQRSLMVAARRADDPSPLPAAFVAAARTAGSA